MTEDRCSAIERMASEIRKCLELQTPVDLELAIENLGGSLHYDDDLPKGSAGRVQKDGDVFRIVVKKSDIPQRQKFTIAHEIGHLFLHMGYLVDPDKWHATSDYEDSVFLRYGFGVEEEEANAFAAAFLMPKREFTAFVYQSEEFKADRIAEHFETSKDAALTRARKLGMLCEPA